MPGQPYEWNSRRGRGVSLVGSADLNGLRLGFQQPAFEQIGNKTHCGHSDTYSPEPSEHEVTTHNCRAYGCVLFFLMDKTLTDGKGKTIGWLKGSDPSNQTVMDVQGSTKGFYNARTDTTHAITNGNSRIFGTGDQRTALINRP